MQAPKVDVSTSTEHLREQLQDAINLMARIFTDIQGIPAGAIYKYPAVESVASYSRNAEQKLSELAGDPIPF